MKISIIVPVYNAKEYLPKCIESILSQTYSKIELILVDDGSSDGSEAICDEYAGKDSRVKVMHQANAGSTNARKNGVNAATGEYVAFVDCDDWVDEDFIEKMFTALERSASEHRVEGKMMRVVPDIIVAGILRDYVDDGRTVELKSSLLPGLYYTDNYQSSDNKTMSYMLTHMISDGEFYNPGVIPSMCAKLYRIDILKKVIELVPEELTMGEDAVCTYLSILDSKSVYIMEDFYPYHYRFVEGSQSIRVDEKYFEKVQLLISFLQKEFTNSTVIKNYKPDSIDSQRFLFLAQRLFYKAFLIQTGLDMLFNPANGLDSAKRKAILKNAKAELGDFLFDVKDVPGLPSYLKRRLGEWKHGQIWLLELDYRIGQMRAK